MNLEAISESHSRSEFSPEATLICSLVYALTVSIIDSPYALTLASLIPIALMRRINPKSLIALNIINIIMIITLAFTWPSLESGLMKGMTIALRVNMIYIVFGALIYPMGYSGIFASMNSLNVPEKFRLLMLLTLRGIFIMHDRFKSALISLRLRAPNLHGLMKFRMFAYITASVLLQSSERSDRMMRAIQCRGGFKGFIQSENERMRMRDVIVCVVFSVYALMIIILNYA